MQDGEVARAARFLGISLGAIANARKSLVGEGLRLRAMALTYISLFALVPALVVVFTAVRSFTGTERMTESLHRFLIDNLTVGASETLEPYLARFIANAHATSAGLVGALFLVGSALSLFANIDKAINETWGIGRRRRLSQQVVVYWVGLTLGPLLLAGSLTLATTARTFIVSTSFRDVAVVGGILLTCAVFSVLYATVPVTKVRTLPAVAGGLAAGLSWEGAKFGYAFLVAKIFQYHAIYGSVAAVPIFILWLYVSWSIVLFGARLAYVVQHRAALLAQAPDPSIRAGREVLAGQALLTVACAFDRGEPPPDAAEVASRMGADGARVEELLTLLCSKGLLVTASAGGLLPASSLERITLDDVRRAVLGDELPRGRGSIVSSIRSAEQEISSRLAEFTFRDLCDREMGLPTRASARVPTPKSP